MKGNLFVRKDVERLGALLRNVREFKGLTREQASRKTGVSVSWIKKLETGISTPEKSKLESYCNGLNTSIELEYNYIVATEKKEHCTVTTTQKRKRFLK